ncbi:MAG: hypothetical protein VYB80_05285, partial [Actinomycetota bacterium]|nr:hypothetical protein [Actinomycetota bacterium]
EANTADLIICTEARTPRAMPSMDLAVAARKVCSEVEIATDPQEALQVALSCAEADDLILGTGSLYVVGAIRDAYMSFR